ncbi:MAG: arylsulfatase [Cytophagales bacterium]|nr:arylsulfatase [Cytophagales bacterium]
MKHTFFALFIIIFISCNRPADHTLKPNIIYILADDLGYAELGAYGQEKIETPHIDRLAETGIKFAQHYAGSPVCAPSRCVLLTGKHSGRAQIRGNDEWPSRGEVWDYVSMIKDSTLEGQRPLKRGTVTIGTLLKEAGYTTAAVGKWGLGAPHTEGIPNKQGFDLFYGYNCQRQAHTYYPVHLYKNENRVYLDNDTIPPHTKLDKDADPLDPGSYARFTLNNYSPDLMFKEIQAFVMENKDNPFFLYWATPIPHAPFQVTDEWVKKYVDKFGDEDPYLSKSGYFPHRYPHAAYAGMISYMDDQVGQLVAQLKRLGIYENTLIMFSSDNGPTFNGGSDSEWFDSAKPFKSDQGWGKGSLREGGIRVPMIASWPAKILPGTTTDHVSAFYDVLPTLAEVAGISTDYKSDGISFLSVLLDDGGQKAHDFLYWEFPAYNGQQAVRMGKWKGIRMNIFKGDMKIELFDLENDPREQHDVAGEYPEVVSKIERIMEKEHTVADNERFKIKELGD